MAPFMGVWHTLDLIQPWSIHIHIYIPPPPIEPDHRGCSPQPCFFFRQTWVHSLIKQNYLTYNYTLVENSVIFGETLASCVNETCKLKVWKQRPFMNMCMSLFTAITMQNTCFFFLNLSLANIDIPFKIAYHMYVLLCLRIKRLIADDARVLSNRYFISCDSNHGELTQYPTTKKYSC